MGWESYLLKLSRGGQQAAADAEVKRLVNLNEKGGLFSRLKLRGKDLNLRPLGYEPNELPLLHPAVWIFII